MLYHPNLRGLCDEIRRLRESVLRAGLEPADQVAVI
jgi:hypothetical protein